MMIPSERAEANKVTLEELLRLKRAERPAPEFWNQFEQDLRAKQLAAIVARRPWWVSLRLPQLGRQAARWQVPLGAAAALAVAFVAVREYRGSNGVVPAVEQTVVARLAVEPTPGVESVSAVASVATPVVPDGVALEIAEPMVNEVAAIQEPAAVVRDTAGVSGPTEFAITESLTEMIPWATARAEGRALADTMGGATGELPQVHFASLVAPGRDHDFAKSVEVDGLRVAAVAPREQESAQEVVASISPREVRRDRILSNLAAAEVASADGDRSRLGRVREILVSSLDDDRLTDSVRRVGMGGDRLTLKF